MELVRTLTYAHRMMERVLMLIRFQADTLQGASDVEGFTLLSNAIGYMHNYPRLIHHPLEEAIFERVNRSTDSFRSLYNHLAEQHALFERQEVALLENVDKARWRNAVAMKELKSLAVTYCVEHAKHIRKEEGEAFPEAERWLSQEDWREVGETSQLHVDPLLDRQTMEHYKNLYDYLMAADVNFRRH